MFFNNYSLRNAVKLWFENEERCIREYGHISNWNTSKVTDMSFLFHFRKTFNIELNWDTSSLTNSMGMFYGCIKYNKPVRFNMKNVYDASAMFFNCKEFDQEITFDLSKTHYLIAMFSGCKKLSKKVTFLNFCCNIPNVNDNHIWKLKNYKKPLSQLYAFDEREFKRLQHNKIIVLNNFYWYWDNDIELYFNIKNIRQSHTYNIFWGCEMFKHKVEGILVDIGNFDIEYIKWYQNYIIRENLKNIMNELKKLPIFKGYNSTIKVLHITDLVNYISEFI